MEKSTVSEQTSREHLDCGQLVHCLDWRGADRFEWHKLAGFRLERKDLPRFKLVDPAVQSKVTAGESRSHGRMRPQMLHLNQHVLFDRRGQPRAIAGQMSVVLFDDPCSCVGMAQPGLDRVEAVRLFRMQDRLHGSTVGMATDDDIPDVQDTDRIFNGGSLSSVHDPVSRNDVAGVAQDEQLPRICLRQQAWIDALIRAGNTDRFGLLTLSQALK